MKIAYKSNIDAYKGAFEDQSTTYGISPQVGQMRMVRKGFEPMTGSHKLPPMLEIKQVIIHDDWIEVDLWFSSLQVQSLKQRGVNPLGG